MTQNKEWALYVQGPGTAPLFEITAEGDIILKGETIGHSPELAKIMIEQIATNFL